MVELCSREKKIKKFSGTRVLPSSSLVIYKMAREGGEDSACANDLATLPPKNTISCREQSTRTMAHFRRREKKVETSCCTGNTSSSVLVVRTMD